MSDTPIADTLDENIATWLAELRGAEKVEMMDLLTFFAKAIGNVTTAVRSLEESLDNSLPE